MFEFMCACFHAMDWHMFSPIWDADTPDQDKALTEHE